MMLTLDALKKAARRDRDYGHRNGGFPVPDKRSAAGTAVAAAPIKHDVGERYIVPVEDDSRTAKRRR